GIRLLSVIARHEAISNSVSDCLVILSGNDEINKTVIARKYHRLRRDTVTTAEGGSEGNQSVFFDVSRLPRSLDDGDRFLSCILKQSIFSRMLLPRPQN